MWMVRIASTAARLRLWLVQLPRDIGPRDPITWVVPGYVASMCWAVRKSLGKSWLAIACAAYGRTAGVSIFRPRARHMR
jgi:hypothetical protein